MGGDMALVEYSVLDARMRHLVIGSAHLERLDSSSRWAEGPVYFPAGDYLLWSDIPNNRVMQWAEGMGVRCLSTFAYNCNGSTRDARGRRITCEHLSRSVVRFEADGRKTVLASAYEGRRLNSPNDVVVASDGAIWFTDPSYGILSDYEGERATPEQTGCFVYRVDPATSAVECKIRTMRMPNGLAFSPDERTLYVADSSRSHDDSGHHHVLAFSVDADWRLGDPRVFATIEHGVPDGLRVDERGNVWISSGRGIEVFASDSTQLGTLFVPEAVANLTFGGPKNNRLFIAATTSVYAVYTAVRGANFPMSKD
jgi:gluconolactonase